MKKQVEFQRTFRKRLYRIFGISLLVFLLYAILFIVYSLDLTPKQTTHLIISTSIFFIASGFVIDNFFFQFSNRIDRYFRANGNPLIAYKEALQFPHKFSMAFSGIILLSLIFIFGYMLIFAKISLSKALIIFIGGILFLVPAAISCFFVASLSLIRVKEHLFRKIGINSIANYKILPYVPLNIKFIFFAIVISLYTFSGFAAFFLNNLNTIDLDKNTLNEIITGLIVIISVNLILALIFSILLNRNIVFPLNLLKKNFRKISKGNLKEKAKIISCDEVGSAAGLFNLFLYELKIFVEKLNDISTTILHVSESLSAISEEMASNSQQVTVIINSVAESISGQLEQVRHIVRQSENIDSEALAVLASAEKSSKVIRKVVASASAGQETSEQSVTNINILVKKSEKTIVGMKKLTEKIEQIGKIAETINALAVQTNFLALNAAIESNRAEEKGAGFSVISQEIRNLNEDTSIAAQRISEIITEIQLSTQEVIKQIELVSTQVEHSRQSIEETGKKLNLISKKVRDTDSKIRQINRKANSQRSLIRKTAHLIVEMASNSENNARAADLVSTYSQEQTAIIAEVAQSAHLISEKIMQLNELINKFN